MDNQIKIFDISAITHPKYPFFVDYLVKNIIQKYNNPDKEYQNIFRNFTISESTLLKETSNKIYDYFYGMSYVMGYYILTKNATFKQTHTMSDFSTLYDVCNKSSYIKHIYVNKSPIEDTIIEKYIPTIESNDNITITSDQEKANIALTLINIEIANFHYNNNVNIHNNYAIGANTMFIDNWNPSIYIIDSDINVKKHNCVDLVRKLHFIYQSKSSPTLINKVNNFMNSLFLHTYIVNKVSNYNNMERYLHVKVVLDLLDYICKYSCSFNNTENFNKLSTLLSNFKLYYNTVFTYNISPHAINFQTLVNKQYPEHILEHIKSELNNIKKVELPINAINIPDIEIVKPKPVENPNSEVEDIFKLPKIEIPDNVLQPEIVEYNITDLPEEEESNNNIDIPKIDELIDNTDPETTTNINENLPEVLDSKDIVKPILSEVLDNIDYEEPQTIDTIDPEEPKQDDTVNVVNPFSPLPSEPEPIVEYPDPDPIANEFKDNEDIQIDIKDKSSVMKKCREYLDYIVKIKNLISVIYDKYNKIGNNNNVDDINDIIVSISAKCEEIENIKTIYLNNMSLQDMAEIEKTIGMSPNLQAVTDFVTGINENIKSVIVAFNSLTNDSNVPKSKKDIINDRQNMKKNCNLYTLSPIKDNELQNINPTLIRNVVNSSSVTVENIMKWKDPEHKDKFSKQSIEEIAQAYHIQNPQDYKQSTIIDMLDPTIQPDIYCWGSNRYNDNLNWGTELNSGGQAGPLAPNAVERKLGFTHPNYISVITTPVGGLSVKDVKYDIVKKFGALEKYILKGGRVHLPLESGELKDIKYLWCGLGKGIAINQFDDINDAFEVNDLIDSQAEKLAMISYNHNLHVPLSHIETYINNSNEYRGQFIAYKESLIIQHFVPSETEESRQDTYKPETVETTVQDDDEINEDNTPTISEVSDIWPPEDNESNEVEVEQIPDTSDVDNFNVENTPDIYQPEQEIVIPPEEPEPQEERLEVNDSNKPDISDDIDTNMINIADNSDNVSDVNSNKPNNNNLEITLPTAEDDLDILDNGKINKGTPLSSDEQNLITIYHVIKKIKNLDNFQTLLPYIVTCNSNNMIWYPLDTSIQYNETKMIQNLSDSDDHKIVYEKDEYIQIRSSKYIVQFDIKNTVTDKFNEVVSIINQSAESGEITYDNINSAREYYWAVKNSEEIGSASSQLDIKNPIININNYYHIVSDYINGMKISKLNYPIYKPDCLTYCPPVKKVNINSNAWLHTQKQYSGIIKNYVISNYEVIAEHITTCKNYIDVIRLVHYIEYDYLGKNHDCKYILNEELYKQCKGILSRMFTLDSKYLLLSTDITNTEDLRFKTLLLSILVNTIIFN